MFEKIGHKISGVKGFGVEVSLSETLGKKYSSQAATPLAGSNGSHNFASNVGSIGLEYVSQLDEIVRRDKAYLKVVFGRPDEELSQLDHAEDLAKGVITPR